MNPQRYLLLAALILLWPGTARAERGGGDAAGAINVIFDSPKTAAPGGPAPSLENSSVVTLANSDGHASNALTIERPISLNAFAIGMARKAHLTFVPNPLVTGDVTGTFINTDPIEMLRQAARALGYTLNISDEVIELQNDATRKSEPMRSYHRVLRYLRAPYVRDPGSVEASLSVTGGISENNTGSGGNTSTNTSGNGSSGSQGNPSAVTGSQAERLTSLLRGVLSKDAYLNYDQKTNTIVARDYEDNIQDLDNLLNVLDVDKPNILCTVTAWEVESDPSSFRGVDWSNALGSTGTTFEANISQALVAAFTGGINITNLLGGPLTSTGAVTQSNPTYVFSPGQVSATIRFLNTRNLIQNRARWFAISEDNESALTNIGTQEPIITTSPSTANVPGSGQVSYVNVGAILRITPQLRPGGIVRLQLRPELSNITGTLNSQGTEAPVIDTRSTEVIVSMPLGCSLVLGGLQNVMRNDSDNKVPFFGDIPLLGPALFGSKSHVDTNRNLVLVVEPKLVDYTNPSGFASAVQAQVDRFKWQHSYGSASEQNVESTVKPYRWGAGELEKDAPETITPISPAVKETP